MSLVGYRTKTAEMTGSGDEVIALDSGYFGNTIVITERSTGTLTFSAKPRGGDAFDAITDGTLDLSANRSFTITDAPISELQITADAPGTYTITVYQFDDKLSQ